MLFFWYSQPKETVDLSITDGGDDRRFENKTTKTI